MRNKYVSLHIVNIHFLNNLKPHTEHCHICSEYPFKPFSSVLSSTYVYAPACWRAESPSAEVQDWWIDCWLRPLCCEKMCCRSVYIAITIPEGRRRSPGEIYPATVTPPQTWSAWCAVNESTSFTKSLQIFAAALICSRTVGWMFFFVWNYEQSDSILNSRELKGENGFYW